MSNAEPDPRALRRQRPWRPRRGAGDIRWTEAAGFPNVGTYISLDAVVAFEQFTDTELVNRAVRD